ncbi:unnamed protein product [Caretta caretta]
MALRRSQVLSYLREGGYSVVFLQETHTDPTAEDRWRLEWGDGVYFSHCTAWQAGVATLFSPTLRPEVLGVTEAVPGHLLHLRVRLEGLVVNFVNIYAPQPVGGRELCDVLPGVLAGLAGAVACLSSVRRWWDLGKVRAKLFCRNHTRGTSRRRNAAIEQLEREVLELERRLAASPGDPSLRSVPGEAGGNFEPSRTTGPEVPLSGPASASFGRWIAAPALLRLEKRGGPKTRHLPSSGRRHPLTDPEEMCGRARDFYANLFSRIRPILALRVLWEELPTVSVGDRDRLELPLTLAEFSEAPPSHAHQ